MRPKDRTRSKITERKRTPGGKLKTYRVKKTKRTVRQCLECGRTIHGTKIKKKLPKTQRHPRRKYGSVLCVSCLQDKLKSEARRQ